MSKYQNAIPEEKPKEAKLASANRTWEVKAGEQGLAALLLLLL